MVCLSSLGVDFEILFLYTGINKSTCSPQNNPLDWHRRRERMKSKIISFRGIQCSLAEVHM